jgi:hypothetical protein
MNKKKGISTIAIIMLIGVAMIAIGFTWFIISSLVLRQQEQRNENGINRLNVNETGILNGTVEEVWPERVGIYFASSDLPTTKSYEGYYINFPGSEEKDCLLIARYMFPVSGFNKGNIGFNFESSIKKGDKYLIWETLEQCQHSTT